MCFKLILVDRNNNFYANEYKLGFKTDGSLSLPKSLSTNAPGVAIGGTMNALYVYYVSTNGEMLMQELNGSANAMYMADFFKQNIISSTNSSIATADSSVVWVGFVKSSNSISLVDAIEPGTPMEVLDKNVNQYIGPITITDFVPVVNKYVVYIRQGMLHWFPIISGSALPTITTNHGGPDQVVLALCNADKRQEIFYADSNYQIHHRWESTEDVTSKTPTFSQGAVALNGCYVNKNHVRIVGARNSDGRLEIFFLGQDDYIYHAWQTNNTENGAWSMPQRLYNGNDGIDVAVTYNPGESRLEAYILTKTQQIKAMYQVAGGWNEATVIHNLDLHDNATFLTVMEGGTSDDAFAIVAN